MDIDIILWKQIKVIVKTVPPSQDKKKNKLIYQFNLKTSKPQNLKTSKPQNLKTSKPQNLFFPKPTSSLMSVSNYVGSTEGNVPTSHSIQELKVLVHKQIKQNKTFYFQRKEYQNLNIRKYITNLLIQKSIILSIL